MKNMIVCVQKNEKFLLESWIKHHSNIFGHKSLIIIDDQSDDPLTLDILNLAEAEGLTVIRSTKPAFEDKGGLISNIIKDNSHKADWYFPTDCDEFIGVENVDGIDFGLESIIGELCKVNADVNILRIHKTYYNYPGKLGHFYKSGTRKVVVRGGVDVLLDKGYHLYDWSKNCSILDYGDINDTNFVHFHMHNKPFELLIESTRNKMRTRLPSFDKEAVLNYRGDGMHLIKYLLMTEKEYLDSFSSQKFSDFSSLFSRSGVKLPY